MAKRGAATTEISASSARLLLDMERITVRMWDRLIFPDTSWQIREGQQWAVLGPNASGKTALARAICGELPCAAGRIHRYVGRNGYDGIGFVSFELHRRLIARDAGKDLSRFAGLAGGNVYTLTTAGETIQEGLVAPDPIHFKRVTELFGIGELLDRPLRFLSNGETRKTLIARALMRKPDLLILDEPFDGLDAASRERLEMVLRDLVHSGLHLVLITHRRDEIVPEISHVLCVKDCRVLSQGKKQEVLIPETLEALYGPEDPEAEARPKPTVVSSPKQEALIEFRKVSVRYGETLALRSLDWTMRRGENWAVLGPNGSGKTTLISLIYADNLQAYANDIRLFGKKRGSGESIWEIKQRIGHVSPHLQAGYRLDLRVFDVVVSGFFDSVGLYRRPTEEQQTAAAEWIERLGIGELRDRIFSQLSYGERRLVIIVRALVKNPELLALDEPCQGLDPAKRRQVLSMVDRIGFDTPTQILYVTHRQDEMPRCITNILRLG
ncbi:MAG: ATP-binding cassette domain-containing protein [Spirochaetaceae bacterium]|nr:MAG: ATP-binding cassette domain-containing protein [Spirochaetaceae bacterium]